MGTLVCFKCGGSLEDYTLPLRRLEECRACGAELHVCKMCRFYDTSKAKHCAEPIAEEVKDKARANFCDYFTPRPDAHEVSDRGAAETARAKLESLFGERPSDSTATPEDQARKALEDLFKGKSG